MKPLKLKLQKLSSRSSPAQPKRTQVVPDKRHKPTKHKSFWNQDFPDDYFDEALETEAREEAWGD